jgi:O-6-methylguanine DNA methyltransferase
VRRQQCRKRIRYAWGESSVGEFTAAVSQRGLVAFEFADGRIAAWSLLREIPVGQTTNYGALAAKLGTRDARDVTEAILWNAIAILIPCHRVVKKDGSVSGYRWGFMRKRTLLERERQAALFRLV